MKRLGMLGLPVFVLWTVLSSGAQAAKVDKGVFIYDSAKEHDQRAIELGDEGDWTAALEEAQLAVKEEKHLGQYWGNLSYVYLKVGDSEMQQKHFIEAGKNYRKALFYKTDNSAAASNLNECLRCQGRDPFDARTRASEAEQAERSHNWPEAMVEYQICVKQNPSAENYFNLGRCEMLSGCMDGISHLRSALDKDWKNQPWADHLACHRLVTEQLNGASFSHMRSILIEVSERRLAPYKAWP